MLAKRKRNFFILYIETMNTFNCVSLIALKWMSWSFHFFFFVFNFCCGCYCWQSEKSNSVFFSICSQSFLFWIFLYDFSCFSSFLTLLPHSSFLARHIYVFVLEHEFELSCHVISLSVRHSNKMDVCIVFQMWTHRKKKPYTQQITLDAYGN